MNDGEIGALRIKYARLQCTFCGTVWFALGRVYEDERRGVMEVKECNAGFGARRRASGIIVVPIRAYHNWGNYDIMSCRKIRRGK